MLGPILNLAVPDLPAPNGPVHLLKELLWMMSGIDDAVILPNQFLAGIPADGAELVIDVGDRALDVGDRHNGVLIEGKFLVSQDL